MQQVHKLITWDWLGTHYAAQRKSPFKNVQLWQYLVTKLSSIFGFQLILFPFSLILRDHFILSPPTLKYGEGDVFPKNISKGHKLWEINLRGDFLHKWKEPGHGKGERVSQNAFYSNLNTLNMKMFHNYCVILT